MLSIAICPFVLLKGAGMLSCLTCYVYCLTCVWSSRSVFSSGTWSSLHSLKMGDVGRSTGGSFESVCRSRVEGVWVWDLILPSISWSPLLFVRELRHEWYTLSLLPNSDGLRHCAVGKDCIMQCSCASTLLIAVSSSCSILVWASLTSKISCLISWMSAPNSSKRLLTTLAFDGTSPGSNSVLGECDILSTTPV